MTETASRVDEAPPAASPMQQGEPQAEVAAPRAKRGRRPKVAASPAAVSDAPADAAVDGGNAPSKTQPAQDDEDLDAFMTNLKVDFIQPEEDDRG